MPRSTARSCLVSQESACPDPAAATGMAEGWAALAVLAALAETAEGSVRAAVAGWALEEAQ